ncbi:hypothetical protein [Streptomyces sp. NRRL B-3229]|uniref:hypothetical protein n=1 Tax=Streptomyces sp. NRRL B-3229 TaxID=1463836 RepID=UPI00131CB3BE|nr:hypothetical protein [Streptomyces sp. NRRL B-3229]
MAVGAFGDGEACGGPAAATPTADVGIGRRRDRRTAWMKMTRGRRRFLDIDINFEAGTGAAFLRAEPSRLTPCACC